MCSGGREREKKKKRERGRLGGCVREESVRGEESSLDGTLQKRSGQSKVHDGRDTKSCSNEPHSQMRRCNHPWAPRNERMRRDGNGRNRKSTSEKNKYLIPLKSSEIWNLPCPSK